VEGGDIPSAGAERDSGPASEALRKGEFEELKEGWCGWDIKSKESK
jgi:hypothetical protein